jgi:hypothetical protein
VNRPSLSIVSDTNYIPAGVWRLWRLQMSVETQLDTAILNVATLIATITADPKPNYTVDNQKVDWGDYLEILTNKLSILQKARQLAGGPFQRATRMISR